MSFAGNLDCSTALRNTVGPTQRQRTLFLQSQELSTPQHSLKLFGQNFLSLQQQQQHCFSCRFVLYQNFVRTNLTSKHMRIEEVKYSCARTNNLLLSIFISGTRLTELICVVSFLFVKPSLTGNFTLQARHIVQHRATNKQKQRKDNKSNKYMLCTMYYVFTLVASVVVNLLYSCIALHSTICPAL